MLTDGLYRVTTPSLCAGFFIEGGKVAVCAPILRRKLPYWMTLAVCVSAFAGDDGLAVWAEGQKTVRLACEKFIKKFEGCGQQARWQKRIEARVRQRLVDRGTADDAAELQSIALDWASDNEGAIRSRDKGVMLEACFWFLLFIEKGVPPPPAMRDRVTRENFETMARELDSAVADAGPAEHVMPKGRIGGKP
jgi:hypothetical protein